MLVWSIASQKGGVGKTTTVASLAGWFQKENLRVLMIDTDPHASLTSYLGFDYNNVAIVSMICTLQKNSPKKV